MRPVSLGVLILTLQSFSQPFSAGFEILDAFFCYRTLHKVDNGERVLRTMILIVFVVSFSYVVVVKLKRK